MFEKEAEEYWNKDFLKWFKENTPKEGLSENTTFSKQFVYDAYVQGRVDEDNSNEWHYVKDGDLPPEDTKVLAFMAGGEVCIAHFYRKNVWDKIGIVIAWCEIPTFDKE